MTRLHLTSVLVVALLAAPMGAAGAAGTTTAATTTAAAEAPNLEPAPLPDPDMFAPTQRADTDPRLEPALFNKQNQFRGDGFAPGSTSQSYEERHYMPPAGLNLLVPLK